MFVELFPLLKSAKGMVVMTVAKVSATHMRVSLHPHAEDEDDKPDLVPIAFEGTPAELDAAGIDFTPAVVDASSPVNEQIKESAATGKAAAAPAKRAAPAKSTTKTTAGKAAPAKTPAAAPAKAPAAPKESAEDKTKREAEEKAKREAKEKEEAARKKKEAKDKELAELRAKLKALEAPDSGEQLPLGGETTGAS